MKSVERNQLELFDDDKDEFFQEYQQELKAVQNLADSFLYNEESKSPISFNENELKNEDFSERDYNECDCVIDPNEEYDGTSIHWAEGSEDNFFYI